MRVGLPLGVLVVAFVTACSGSSVPAPAPITASPLPSAGQTPLPPGVTPSPTPTPLPPGVTPTPTPTPSPTSTPVALTCAQNAIVGAGVPLGSAAAFAAVAGSVVSAGSTIVNGNLGVSPGSAVTGFPPGVVNGVQHVGSDPVAVAARADVGAAFINAASRLPAAVPADIGGLVIAPGVYAPPISLGITGTVTLDGQNNPNSVFIFQTTTTLTTSIGSSVNVINGANACNVFWQVGTSATINANSTFSGTVLAFASISLGHNATVNGRVLAENGAVTMDTNTVTKTAP